MLVLNEIVEKLNVAPVQFNQLMQEEKYCAAKWLFYDCVATAVVIELDMEAMERLFGENGAFNQELVKIAYEKAGGGIDRSTEDYAKDAGLRRDVRFSFQTERVLASSTDRTNGIKSSIVY